MIQTVCLSGQFPPPGNFSYQLNYIEMDQWGVCNGETVYGPSYCSYFKWDFPDTSLTEATLEYFEIYNVFNGDTCLIHSLPDTFYITTTPYEGDVYVIAVYSNPTGKSEPSNVVTVDEIPVSTDDTDNIPGIILHYDPETEFLQIGSVRSLKHIRIIDSNGQITHNEKNITSGVYVGNLIPGIYIIEITDQINTLYREKIIKE